MAVKHAPTSATSHDIHLVLTSIFKTARRFTVQHIAGSISFDLVTGSLGYPRMLKS